MFEFFLKSLPVQLEGDVVTRQEPCRCCGAKGGIKISRIDYWDIKETDIVKCASCGTAQLDPMLTDDETSKGCLAYYIEETLRTSHKAQEKNNLRNYRRGIHFAFTLKRKNYSPKDILELGPGSGYFLEGIRFVFPDVKISVLDINQELLDFNQQQHGFATILATPEHFIPELKNKFDLIIARDIIEHVTGVDAVFKNVNAYLRKGGLFHFITPNGHEDVWRFYIRYKEKKENSELLINHVNYFDGKGLADHLTRENFKEISYYTYKLKTTFRGRGRKVIEKLMAPVSQKRSADYYVNEKISEIRSVTFDKKQTLNKWYLKPNRKFFARLISWYKHSEWVTVDPRINVGHEILGVFEKVK
jgi:2-polyprenyl-3-methyl-5-hydroxy-6-metoxy-1,4-benzoquinol methylase